MNDERLYRPARPEAAVDQHCADAVDIDRTFVDRKRSETDGQGLFGACSYRDVKRNLPKLKC